MSAPNGISAHTIEKNCRVDSFKAGSLTVCATLGGHDPGTAMNQAVHGFMAIHGRLPDWNRVRFAGFTTTFQTVIEIIEEPA